MADTDGPRPPEAPRRRIPPHRQAFCCFLSGGAPRTSKRPSSLLPSPKNPSPATRLGRILSPGRVSPIDPDPRAPQPLDPLPEEKSLVETDCRAHSGTRCLELRVKLKGKDGACVVMGLDPEVLSKSSAVLKAMILDSSRKATGLLRDCREIVVDDVEDLDAFKETIELMHQKDLTSSLMKLGVSRAIDILEVSSNIKFNHGVVSCSKYLEAVPWSESDEDKLRSLFERCRLDEAASSDVLARLGPHGSTNSEDLAVRLIQSVTNGTVGNARKEMQSLVSGLLSNSSVCHQDPAGLNKESIYCIVHPCLNSLMGLFEEASAGSIPMDRTLMLEEPKPLVERVSRQVDSINWLLGMLIEKQMAEDFVSLWAKQEELLKMYEKSSPMIRYELSRVSACVFIALGRGKLQCPGFTRFSVLRAWFQPMLTDFGWLQRCSKGLDMRLLEESLGEALLTLPLEQQKSFFMEWFQCFSRQVTECPDLSKAFQVWWRRSFARSSQAIRHPKPVTASNLIYSSLFTL